MRSKKNLFDIYPLTPLQRGILFHSVDVSGDDAPYYYHSCFRLRGSLDKAALKRAWALVVQRHEMLRADVQWHKTREPVLLVYREAPLSLRELTWLGTSERDAGDRVAAFVREERARAFEFERSADSQLTLIQVAADEHYLVWGYHHISLDGWSVANVLGEVLTCYHAEVTGQALHLPAVPSYRSYLEWLEAQDETAAERYFRGVLAGYEPLARFPPPAWQRRAVTQKFGEQRLLLDADESERLRRIARTFRVTLNTVFQGLWALLLKAYSGGDSAVFGVTISGRTSSVNGMDHMIGMFINTLPLRVDVSAQQRFGTWIQSVQDRGVELLEHGFTSLPKVARWAGVQPGQPLFESILVFDNYPIKGALEQGADLGLEIRVFDFESRICDDVAVSQGRNNYPLSLLVAPGERLSIATLYHRDRVPDEGVRRLLGSLRRLLNALPGDRDCSLQQLSAAIHGEFAGSAVASPPGVAPGRGGTASPSVHESIGLQAKRRPAAVALRFEEESLTYAELERRANGLAHGLRQRGVRAAERVGIRLSRGIDLVVAIYAVLKCGAAYVPLEPKLPAERVRDMIQDFGARIVIGGGALDGLAVEVLDPKDPAWDAPAAPRVNAAVCATSPAYVLYTSGSTGRPKGVEVTHGGLMSYVRSLLERVPVEAGASMAMVSTVAADLGNTVLFGALCSGGTLHLISEERAFDPDGVGEYMARHGVEVMKIVPSHLKGLMQARHPERVLPRRALILGGEATSWELVEAIRKAGQCRIINHYGPTETTVGALTYELADEKPESGSLPLGRALGNSRVLVLNGDLQVVPAGVVGEIYIGGLGVANGYLNRAELTAERFIPDVYEEGGGGRLYRTGDRGRYLEDGSIEFLGRQDHQVKIRGYRVELGEVASALRSVEGILDAEVLLTAGQAGNPRLVAYLIGAAGERDAERASARLRERLPDYMVPNHYVWLESFPVTANGKLDRAALPEPGAAPPVAKVAPRTELEKKLATIWCDVLKIEDVGVHDNFFKLGGESLLAFQVIAAARKVGIVLSPTDLFDHQTLATLAAAAARSEPSPDAPAESIIPHADRTAPIPASYAQQRLWFLWQLEPESAAYNVAIVLGLSGRLSHRALERAFTELVRRHESLRTRFVERDGRVFQRIDAAAPVAIPTIHLRLHPPHEREPMAEKLAREEAALPFDLTEGPLVRVKLLELAEGEYRLLVTLHHIICDGWSANVLASECRRLYTAYCEGLAPDLPELPVQYADYAVWQRQWLDSGELSRQLEYWKAELGTRHPVLELPADRARPALSTSRGAAHERTLDPELVRRLRSLAEARDTTLFTLLLAAFQVLLHRYSGQTEIRVGVPIAGRTRAELEPLIGFLVNTLVLRTAFGDTPTFDALLERVKATARGAFSHQDLPFEQLVEALNPARSLQHSPLFQVLYNHQRVPERVLAELPGLRLTRIPQPQFTTQFDLTLDTYEQDDSLVATWTYSTDLFEPDTIVRLARHWEILLEAIVRGPEQRVDHLPLLTPGERLAIERRARGEPVALTGERCVHELISAQAERTPDAVAVIYEGARLSYRELEERANQLAHALVARGVGPDVLVAIFAERSLELAIAVLSVLKAGGAYVPLDPDYPAERLRYMLADARPRVVLTQERLLSRLPAEHGSVLCLDREEGEIAGSRGESPESGVHARNLAYCIYTSGSTGRPKGAGNSHAALRNRLAWMQETYHLERSDRVLQKTSLSFDVSVWEFFWPWLAGATLVIAPPGAHRDPHELGALIAREGVTVLHFVPSMLQAFLASGELERASSLRHVVCSGEALPKELARKFAERHPARLHNLYGPTEAAIDVTSWEYVEEPDRTRVPIGRPISNLAVYVLDRALGPVPSGVIGELYIGGVGLARGYVHRPELTAERFVPSPFGEGERLYRTGDLARYRPDGVIEYVGRNDHQVKIRGFRVELEEIEARLAADEGVAEAVVRAREDVPGDQRLVAYVVPTHESGSGHPDPSFDGAPASGPSDARAQLRDRLRDRLRSALPEYMVPGHYVFLEQMPVTVNGKLDVAALPPPGTDELRAMYRAPETELERQLEGLWRDVLGLERVGVDDDFFEIGGHSLLATQIVSRLREQLGVELPLRELFETTTIASLARAIEPRLADSAVSRDVELIAELLDEVAEAE